MSLQNWSMTALGYPANTRAQVPVIGLSHMSTFAAMRFAEELGIRSGWLMADGATPQLEHIRRGAPTGVNLRDLIADRRVAHTEGMATGTLVFVAGSSTSPRPPAEAPLAGWAAAQGQVWIEIIDNEVAYWGGLDQAQSERLLVWFCCQRSLDAEWSKLHFDPRTWARLRAGLFDHGWTRNLELINSKRVTTDLWGGVHKGCLLEHATRPLPRQLHVGVCLRRSLGELVGDELDETCPLADDTGRLSGRRSGLFGG